MTIDLFNLQPLIVQTPTSGEVALRWLSYASQQRLEGLRADAADDQVFMRRALHEHIAAPDIPFEDFEGWPADDVNALARGWSRWQSALGCELPAQDVEKAFGLAFHEHAARSAEQLKHGLKAVRAEIANREAAMRMLGSPPQSFLASPPESLLASIRASEGLSRISKNFSGGLRGMRAAVAAGPLLQSTRTLVGLANAFQSFKPLGSSFQDLGAMTAGVRAAAEQAALLNAGIRARLDPPAGFLTFGTGLESLAAAAGSVVEDWAQTGVMSRFDSQWLREAPALEPYSASRSALSLLHQTIEPAPRAAKRIEAVAGTAEALLGASHPNLVEMLRGAVAALEGGGPDCRRHFASSCRELLTQVLHRLAPDDSVKNWPAALPQDFHKGRPTRRARARFILRHTGSTAYGEFAKNDADQVVQLLDFLQGPTHGVQTLEDLGALRLVLIRVEAFLALLLEADRLGH